MAALEVLEEEEIDAAAVRRQSLTSRRSSATIVGRNHKISQLRAAAISQLEDLLAIKLEEVAILEKQLSILSESHVRETQIIDPYGDSGIYTGQVEEGTRPNGKGTMKYDDGRVYIGEWVDGRWHGEGSASFANGDSYSGLYRYDQRHGKGTYKWHDGRVYDGEFEHDKRQGQGLYSWPDGAKFKGRFKDGQHNGYGEYTFADGSLYKGEWKHGVYDGKGECKWSDGRHYKGEWSGGKAHGIGKETNPDGTIRHDGQWEYDRPIRDYSGPGPSPSSTKSFIPSVPSFSITGNSSKTPPASQEFSEEASQESSTKGKKPKKGISKLFSRKK